MKVIWPGEPGESYTNGGESVLYQFVCSFTNTCGACAQYHLAVAKWWPKIHHGCNCRVEPIYPGQKSRPYEDWRDIVQKLPEDQQAALVGSSLWKLLQAGEVKWEDVVTSSRVRLLREVVSRNRIEVSRMTSAGVSPRIAQQAYASVNTPAHQLAQQQQATLVRQILGLGVQPQTLAEMFGEKMAQRVAIAGGPSRTSAMPTAGFRSQADWVAILQGSFKVKAIMGLIGPKPNLATQAELDRLRGLLGEHPLEWLKEIEAGLRAGKVYPREVMAKYRQLGGVQAD